MDAIKKRFPFLLSVLFIALAMILPWGALYPFLQGLGTYWGGSLRYGITLMISLLLIAVFHRRFPFSLKTPHFWKDLFTFGLIGLIGSMMGFAFSFGSIDRVPAADEAVGLVVYSLLIALSEEALFRELIFPLFLKSYAMKKNGEVKAAILTSVLFGLRHLLGLLENPGSYGLTMAQVLFTFMAGVYLCALLLRTKDVWCLVLIHFLIDFLSAFWGLFSSAAAFSSNRDIAWYSALLIVAAQTPYLIFGLFFLLGRRWKGIEPIAFSWETKEAKKQKEKTPEK